MHRMDLYQYKASQTEKEYRNALDVARAAHQRAAHARSVAQVKRDQLWQEIASLKGSPRGETSKGEVWRNGGAHRLEVASREFRHAASIEKKADGELARTMQTVQYATVKRDLSQALYGAEKRRVSNGRERMREEEIMDLSIVQREQGRLNAHAVQQGEFSQTTHVVKRPGESVIGEARSRVRREDREGDLTSIPRSPLMAREGVPPQPVITQTAIPQQQVEAGKASEQCGMQGVVPVSVTAAHLERGERETSLRMQCETSSGVPVGMTLRQESGGGITVKLSSLNKGMVDQLMLERSAIASKVSALGIKVKRVEVDDAPTQTELDSPQAGLRSRARRRSGEEDESVIA